MITITIKVSRKHLAAALSNSYYRKSLVTRLAQFVIVL